jgi:hypothetical protein
MRIALYCGCTGYAPGITAIFIDDPYITSVFKGNRRSTDGGLPQQAGALGGRCMTGEKQGKTEEDFYIIRNSGHSVDFLMLET